LLDKIGRIGSALEALTVIANLQRAGTSSAKQ
jgi:hypothetical protein